MIGKTFKDKVKRATPLEKALLVCKGNIDRKINRMEPTVSDEEAQFIIDGVRDEERTDYNRWVANYNTYRNITSLFGLCYAEYSADANALTALLGRWRCYKDEVQHIQILLDKLIEAGHIEAAGTFVESVAYINLHYAHIDFSAEKGFSLRVNDEDPLFVKIRKAVKSCSFSLSILKSFIIALEEYSEEKGCEVMMPDSLVDGIRDAKTDVIGTIDPAYSKCILDKKKAEGMKVSEEEEREGIFPYYEDTDADPQYLNLWRERIKELSDYDV